MKCSPVLVAFLALVVATGCSEPRVIAEASLQNQSTGERLALGDLPIRLLPYDRDAVFDSLEAAHGQPEPAIPPEILAQQQQVQEAQTAWRRAEEQLTTIRDSLRIVQASLTQMQSQGQRESPLWAETFARFGTLEVQEREVNQQVQETFALFNQLQQQTRASVDSIRVQRDLWAEEAFADFETVVQQKLNASGFEEQADTTDSQGIAVFSVPEGAWWVYGRYTLPFEELYWNIPVEVASDSVHVRLNRENADIRPVL
jgi:hypothetical protein